MILPCPIISNAMNFGRVMLKFLGKQTLVMAPLVIFASCASPSETPSNPSLASGSISYPFIAETRPLGHAKAKQPFIVRSAMGAREYTVEIPDNAARYDIQIPLAELSTDKTGDIINLSSNGSRIQGVNPANTDKELVSALPDLAKTKGIKTELMDTAFGVGRPEGPIQSPSYTLGIARVNQHFKDRNFEIALVELNNLLTFYPNSPKLLKMKGTLLVKTGNRELGMRAWQRALDLLPDDLALRASIDRLNERMLAERRSTSPASPSTQTSDPSAINGQETDAILDKTSPAH